MFLISARRLLKFENATSLCGHIENCDMGDMMDNMDNNSMEEYNNNNMDNNSTEEYNNKTMDNSMEEYNYNNTDNRHDNDSPKKNLVLYKYIYNKK